MDNNNTHVINNINDVNELEFSCKICTNTQNIINKKILQCNHYLCTICYNKLIIDNTIMCPFCRYIETIINDLEHFIQIDPDMTNNNNMNNYDDYDYNNNNNMNNDDYDYNNNNMNNNDNNNDNIICSIINFKRLFAHIWDIFKQNPLLGIIQITCFLSILFTHIFVILFYGIVSIGILYISFNLELDYSITGTDVFLLLFLIIMFFIIIIRKCICHST
jgi:hypothetical protein